MTREQAMLFLGYMLGRVGKGYHPDTSICDYRGRTGFDTFSNAECIPTQKQHDLMIDTLGHENVCKAAMHLLWEVV